MLFWKQGIEYQKLWALEKYICNYTDFYFCKMWWGFYCLTTKSSLLHANSDICWNETVLLFKKNTAFPNMLKLESYGERLQITYFNVFPFKNKNTILECLIKYQYVQCRGFCHHHSAWLGTHERWGSTAKSACSSSTVPNFTFSTHTAIHNSINSISQGSDTLCRAPWTSGAGTMHRHTRLSDIIPRVIA